MRCTCTLCLYNLGRLGCPGVLQLDLLRHGAANFARHVVIAPLAGLGGYGEELHIPGQLADAVLAAAGNNRKTDLFLASLVGQVVAIISIAVTVITII